PCGPLISTPPPVGSPHCETVPPSGRPTCVAPDPGAGAVDEAHVPVPGPAACTGRLMPPKPRMPSPPTVAVVTSSRSFKVPSIVVVVDTASGRNRAFLAIYEFDANRKNPFFGTRGTIVSRRDPLA